MSSSVYTQTTLYVHVGLFVSVSFNEWMKGEASLLFNKKFNIVFFLPWITYSGRVTRQTYRYKYPGGLQYITITARENETILHFPLYFKKISCIVDITLSNSISNNKIS